MPNIHGLSSFSNNKNDKNKDDDSDEDDHNNRYVGGVDSRGGGSGLAVVPNPSQPVEGMFNLASAHTSSSESPPDQSINRHIITMYRSGFTVDNGAYRRLDDPANAEFLQSLAAGRTPREFGSSSEIQVGLVDKRQEEYSASSENTQQQSFSGAGEAVGSGGSAEEGSHVIDPNSSIDQKEDEDANDQTSIQIRLLSSKRLVVKISKSATVKHLAAKINASGMAGTEPYVLSAGYPPRILKEMNATVAEAGLAGGSVIQKKASN